MRIFNGPLTAAVVALVALMMTTSDAHGQEAVATRPQEIPAAKGSADADVEFAVARGDIKLADACGKVKAKPARTSLGCDKAATLKDVKKVFEGNTESSAWEALSALDETKHGATESQQLVDKIMEDVLGSVKIKDNKLSFGTKLPTETTGRTIFACSLHPNCLKNALTAEERVAVAEYLLSVSPITSGVALGLKALSDFGMAHIDFKHEKGAITATVKAVSLVGAPLTWKLGKGTSAIVTASGKPNEIKVSFDPKIGKVARVPVEIELASGLKLTKFMDFEVKADLMGAKLVIKEKNAIKSEHSLGPHPSSLDKVIALEKGESLEVSVNLSMGPAFLCPEQAVFGFLGADGAQYLVPASCPDNKEIKAVVPNGSKLAEELKYVSGQYDVVFIVSDERMSNPTNWRLGKVQLSLSPVPEKKHEPLFTHHLLYESDSTLKALPEIHHQFREPDRRAPFVLSFIFSSAQIGLVVALVANLLFVGIRPADLFKSVKAMFFAGSLALVEIVFAWYWVGPPGAPNMETLAYIYLPPMLVLMFAATRSVLGPSGSTSNKKTGSL